MNDKEFMRRLALHQAVFEGIYRVEARSGYDPFCGDPSLPTAEELPGTPCSPTEAVHKEFTAAVARLASTYLANYLDCWWHGYLFIYRTSLRSEEKDLTATEYLWIVFHTLNDLLKIRVLGSTELWALIRKTYQLIEEYCMERRQ